MGGQGGRMDNDVVDVPSASTWEGRFTYASSTMVDDELVDGGSMMLRHGILSKEVW